MAIARAAKAGAWLLLDSDDDYPSGLRDLPNAPVCLFALGDRAITARPCVAIVGTRRSTPSGERVTRDLAGALARAGACVVSGMARGIDGVAHRSALDAGGATVAVLGTGIDIAYPTAHRPLHRQIAERGLLLSEEMPGDPASAGSFPKRNRLIAALASVTIVVEAGSRSGALITAMHALELGRTVAAVPGPVDVPQNAGSNGLLRDGAAFIGDVADALAVMGLNAARRATPELTSAAQRAVWDVLGKGALDMDSLAASCALPAAECLGAVTALELSGAVECALTGEIRRP
ncbi:MAG: DNA-processing protein DprA [Gemmatimonadota bacterium]|nr:DNA-processing protein DprA [Gemmatimonadota bacterium]